MASLIARWQPVSVSGAVADFARSAVTSAAPKDRARAKALLFAAGKLGAFAASVGLELTEEVIFTPSVIERFIVVETAALGPATVRTLRSNLRFIARAVVAHHPPAPIPLPRERARAPYAPSELAAYLALADAQPTVARRLRLSGLIALGAGAGLMGADLRSVTGSDVVARSGGVIVSVHGPRPRTVPVLAGYHERLKAAACFAGGGYVIGGYSASRRNVTSGLVASAAGGLDLATLEVGRLRATWLVAAAEAIGLGTFLRAAGITCSQRLGDLVAGLDDVDERQAVALLGGAT